VSPQHHDVFHRFDAGCEALPNWIGAMTRREFFADDLQFVAVSLPPFDTEYFEWIDVLEAVVAASESFTMVELGAGYGRWVVNAARALEAYSGIPHLLVAVEAEPTHFKWLELHCGDNDIRAQLVRTAVAARSGSVTFAVGQPRSWYGQAIVDPSWTGSPVETVVSVTLSELLQPLDRVDLIHCDIQGAEADVFEEAAAAVDAKVRRVHVGTHGSEIERSLRKTFSRLGWSNVADYGCGTASKTPWGRMRFGDGVQSWVNPRFELAGR
jgi:FkbM family methyltransferase